MSARTPLAARLAARIAADGPMTVADYMAACLADPEHGYYFRQEPFGPAGDFVTAPEVSQMFGELIGLWCVLAHEAMGAPARFVLAELGPGRGTLMADLLRAARIRPAFGAAAELHLVETSPRLRERQRAALAGLRVIWHDSVDTLPAGPLIVVANEFFDALPVRQFVRTGGGWAERMVGLDAAGRLAFGLRPAAAPPLGGSVGNPSAVVLGRSAAQTRGPMPGAFRRPAGGMGPRVKPEDDSGEVAPNPDGGEAASAPPGGEVVEISPAARAIATVLAERIARDGGAALVIDYGHDAGAGDTLQGVRRHAYDDPLAHPGEADLTAHVDFAALAAAARQAGAEPRRLWTQGAFLAAMGLAARAERLAAGRDAAGAAAVRDAAGRLAGPAAMGTLFKVLAVAAPGLVLPVFDSG